MKRIKLTQGKVAIVDDSDFKWLSKFRWHANKAPDGTWYVRRAVYNPSNQKTTHAYMHRQIMGFPQRQVDHRDGNKLDNRRKNLRVATETQNRRNSKIRSDSTSGLKGVCLFKRTGKFMSSIRIRGKAKYIGYFEDKIDAAKAYDAMAIKHFGKFARTNEMLGLI